jgi:endonuclease/exonuclease/phosphatase family metal-dependent hydrolase
MYTDEGTFKITPYIDQYLKIRYGSADVKVRGKAGEETTVPCPAGFVFNDTETIIYGANGISEIGDLSTKYPGTVDVSKGLKLAAISRYRWSDRFDQQQDVIATTLPVVDSHWSVWKKKSSVKPPRGYVFTSVVIDGVVTANVYAVHLKSNYGQGKDEKKIEDNRRKRSIAIEQIVEMEKPRRRSFRRPVIVAGDLNADKRRKEFSQDTIFKTLDESGFCDVYLNMPEEERYTTEHRYFGKSAIDYIFYRDFSVCGVPEALAVKNVSDHRALFALLDVNKNIVFEKEKKEN